MSIIKPQKLGIISGPGSEYFTGKVVKHLRRLYLERYYKLSSALAKRHGISEEEILKTVTLTDDLSTNGFRSKAPTTFQCPDFTIKTKHVRFANGEVKAEILDPVGSQGLHHP